MSTEQTYENNELSNIELLGKIAVLQSQIMLLNIQLRRQTSESDSVIQSLHNTIEELTILNEELQIALNEYKWIETAINDFQHSETGQAVQHSETGQAVQHSETGQDIVYPPRKLVKQYGCSDNYTYLYEQYRQDMQYAPDPLQTPIIEELTTIEKIAADKDFELKAHAIWDEYEKQNH